MKKRFESIEELNDLEICAVSGGCDNTGGAGPGNNASECDGPFIVPGEYCDRV